MEFLQILKTSLLSTQVYKYIRERQKENMIFVWLDRLTKVWVGDAVIPFDYFPPRINKFMGTDVHNTGKTPEEVRYEVVAPMPGNNRFQESQNISFILNKTTLS
jgi:hypothetical protein